MKTTLVMAVTLISIALTGCNFEPGALVGEDSDNHYYYDGGSGNYSSGSSACRELDLKMNGSIEVAGCGRPMDLESVFVDVKESYGQGLRITLKKFNANDFPALDARGSVRFRALGKSREAEGECKNVTTGADPLDYRVYECKVLSSEFGDFNKYILTKLSIRNERCGSVTHFEPRPRQVGCTFQPSYEEDTRVWAKGQEFPPVRPF